MQIAKSPEIPVGGPKLSDSVSETNRGNPGVVHLGAFDSNLGHPADRVPIAFADLGAQSSTPEAGFAKLESRLLLALPDDLTKPLFNQGTQGRLVSGSQLSSFHKEWFGDLDGRLHMGNRIK